VKKVGVRGRLWIWEPETGILIPTKLFVAVWDTSNCLFARVIAGEDRRPWIDAYVKCFEFCGCAMHDATVPGNFKVVVAKFRHYKLELNLAYSDLAVYYSFYMFPVRSRRLKGKNQSLERYVSGQVLDFCRARKSEIS
jgi:transposase